MKRRLTNMLGQYDNSQPTSEGDSFRGFKNLQKFVKFRQTATFQGKCYCKICLTKKPSDPVERLHYLGREKLSKCPYRDLIECLVAKGKRSLKVCIPDICFFDNNQVAGFYCSNTKDNTIKCPYPIITEKQLQGVFRKHRNQYLDSMKLLFEQGIQKNLTFKEVHQNFSTTILPMHYYEGLVSGVQRKSILKQKKLVVHRDAKLQLEAVSNNSHHEQAAYVVLYTDGNYQLLDATQFWNFIPNRKAYGDMTYIKSYVKPTGVTTEDGSAVINPAPRFIMNQYRVQQEKDDKLFERSAILAGILAQEISVYDQRYISEEIFDEQAEKLRDYPEEYLKMQVYRIINYIQKIQYRKTKYLRSRWVINDLGNFYLNDVMEWEWVKIQKRANQLVMGLQGDYNELLTSINNDEDFFMETFKQVARDRQKQTAKGFQSISTIDDSTLETAKSQIKSRRAVKSYLAQTLEPIDRKRQKFSVMSVTRKIKQDRYKLQPMTFSSEQKTIERSKILDKLFIL